ncbi:MAG: DUF664 domain-containing protein [Candidatus Dormibacteria bacterium]
MPADVRPVTDGRDALLAFLAQQRLVLRVASFGLTDEEARLTATRSALSVGGTIKHVAAVERYWMAAVLERKGVASGEHVYTDNFHMTSAESLDDVLTKYASAAADTDGIIAAILNLGQAVPVPRDVPRFLKEVAVDLTRFDGHFC